MQKSTEATEHMRRVLSDTFVLYMKTYAVHWNYTGANFFSVHKMTEGQYEELAQAVDEIAERIRACGHEAPISLSDILESADLKERASLKPGPEALKDLYQGHQLLSTRAKEAAEILEKEGDDFSHDMLIARIGAHEKAAWMLNSLLR
jgi:starvation-inducible DNA-binding protein